MSRRVKKYKHHLKFISVCEHKSCKRLLGNCDKELIKSICECALNVLHGSIPLQQKNKIKLAKHKNDLRNLASKLVSIQKKKQIVQKGRGFLPLLLGPVLSFLAPLLFNRK